MALRIGSTAPDFQLISDSGKVFRLSEQIAKNPCVLYFYPKNFTSGCTAQACEFRDRFAEFSNLSLEVIGISGDSSDSHNDFKSRHNLPFPLLSDPGAIVRRQYKALVPFLGITKRVSYLIGSDGLIEAVFDDFFNPLAHVGEMIGKSGQ